MDYLRPICKAVDNDEEVMSSIRAKVDRDLLKRPIRSRLQNQLLLRIGREALLTVFTGMNDIIDVIVNPGPIN